MYSVGLMLLSVQGASLASAGATLLEAVPSTMHRQLGDMMVSPILTGMWQVSGGHGYRPDRSAAVADMATYTRAGFNTFDLADHYGEAEVFVGDFRESAAARQSPAQLHYLTKWVPRPATLSEADVRAAMKTSQSRMKMEQLDMLQFHCERYLSFRPHARFVVLASIFSKPAASIK